ncbi:CRTAC1 family protein, partial [bacterium]|nr:CRTAC1 family protein [bacterium]
DLTRITGVDPALTAGSSRAVNWVDYDVDGDLDLYVTNGGSLFENNEFYRNDGGGSFAAQPASPVALDSLRADGSSWGDYDNDGDPDLFVVSWYGELNGFFRNDGAGAFTRILTGAPATTGTFSEGCAWVDYDSDGDLDLYVANSGNGTPGNEHNLLYRNDAGTFVEVSGEPIVGEGSTTRGPSWGDFDNDGDADLFLANEGGENNRLFRNELVETGTATFVELDAAPVTSDGGNSWSGSWGDYDNDGDLDLVVGNSGGEFNFLYRNELVPTGIATFTSLAEGPATNRGWTAGTHWADWDNDADLDLMLTNGWAAFPSQQKRNFYYRNDGGVLVRDQTSAASADSGWAYGAAWGDHDDDGDLDLAVAKWWGSGEENLFYRNEANGNGNHWLRVRCAGVADNTSGIGCRITVTAMIGGESVTQIREITGADGYCSQTLEAHFGLGDATSADVTVRWPSGAVQALPGETVDAVLLVTQETGTDVGEIPAAPGRSGVRLGAARPNPFRGA